MIADGVQFVDPGDVRVWVAEREEAEGGPSLASIPFYSLCRGLFLPLSGMSIDKAGTLFGVVTDAPPDTAGREAAIKKCQAMAKASGTCGDDRVASAPLPGGRS